MAWVEKRGMSFRVRLRLPDGTVTTGSTHDRRPEAVLRAKEIDIEIARDTFVDPCGGRISLGEWVHIWQETHQARRPGRPTAVICACTSCPVSVTFRWWTSAASM